MSIYDSSKLVNIIDYYSIYEKPNIINTLYRNLSPTYTNIL
jgi:hypothetical protein